MINEYYSRQSKTTSPGDYAYLFDELPTDVRALCNIVQGLILHYADQDLLGYNIPTLRFSEMNLRSIEKMLDRLIALDTRPINEARSVDKRLIGVCRDYAVLLCAILRHKNIPARIRVGFSNYFHADIYLDGMCVEYWDKASQRWHMVDARTTAMHIDQFKLPIDFDLQQVPANRFITAAEAWRLCRQGELSPNRFGSRQHRGLWYVRNRLLQEFAVLNKKEVLIWDAWGMMLTHVAGVAHISDDQMEGLDRLSAYLAMHAHDVKSLKAHYRDEVIYQVPSVVTMFNPMLAPETCLVDW